MTSPTQSAFLDREYPSSTYTSHSPSAVTQIKSSLPPASPYADPVTAAGASFKLNFGSEAGKKLEEAIGTRKGISTFIEGVGLGGIVRELPREGDPAGMRRYSLGIVGAYTSTDYDLYFFSMNGGPLQFERGEASYLRTVPTEDYSIKKERVSLGQVSPEEGTKLIFGFVGQMDQDQDFAPAPTPPALPQRK